MADDALHRMVQEVRDLSCISMALSFFCHPQRTLSLEVIKSVTSIVLAFINKKLKIKFVLYK